MIHWNGPLNPLQICAGNSCGIASPPKPSTILHAHWVLWILSFSLSSSHPAWCQYPQVPQHHPAVQGCQLSPTRAVAPGAAGLGKEVEKGALQQSATTQGTAALCKAPSSTLQ